MALHAVQNIGDAASATREFLTPINLRRWLKLAFVAFFVGGGMNLPTGQAGSSGTSDQIPTNGAPVTLTDDVLVLVAAIVGVVVILGLAFAIVGAIMEFVFIESLRTGEVSIRRHWHNRWRQGLRLFGFRILITIPVLAIFFGWMAAFLLPVVVGIGEPMIAAGTFLLGIPVLFVVGIVFGLISAFTTVFVVPLMIKDDSGVLAAWGMLWGSIKSAWKQYLAYAGIGFVLTIATGLLASILLGLMALVLLIPLGLLGLATYLTVSLSSTVGIAIVALLAIVFVLAMVIAWAVVQVPVLAYLRYYALLVLGDIEPEFDIIPDQREAIRE